MCDTFALENIIESTAMRIEMELTVDDFDYVRKLGQGSFGKVILVKSQRRKTQSLMALKQQPKKKELKELVMLEVEILRELRQASFCVQLLASFQSGSFLYLLTDYYSGGSLWDHTVNQTFFSGNRIALLAAELSEALFFLRSSYIVHRDVKPENIMFDAEGHARLIDFGLAFYNRWGEDSQKAWICGTPPFWAPELFQNPPQEYDEMVDWWALGVTLLTLVLKYNPMEVEVDHSDDRYLPALEKKVTSFQLKGGREFRFGLFSRGLKKFIKDLLTQDPRKRLGSSEEEVRDHPLFTTTGLLKGPEKWEALRRRELLPPLAAPKKRETIVLDVNWLNGIEPHQEDHSPLHFPRCDTALDEDGV